jgi:simple sugar transport system ATP-binding protein
MAEPILEVRNLVKMFGSVIALSDVSARVYAGEVTCLLGDNGAGKSTLIKILSGVYQPTQGEYLFEGEKVAFNSPREALNRGIATVYQDLSLIPLMPVWRNFFLGSEPQAGWGPLRHYDISFAKRTVREEMRKMGIDIRDPDQPVGTMSGGERQSIAISRAVYFGAKVLILDEPTAALGVKQAGIVLNYIVRAKQRGLGVIFITHNPNHAYPVADHFIILRRGRVLADHPKAELQQDELMNLMAGGEDLVKLQQELEQLLQAPNAGS